MEAWQWARALKWELRCARIEEAVKNVRVSSVSMVVRMQNVPALIATFDLSDGRTWTSTVDQRLFDKYATESMAIETVLSLREAIGEKGRSS